MVSGRSGRRPRVGRRAGSRLPRPVGDARASGRTRESHRGAYGGPDRRERGSSGRAHSYSRSDADDTGVPRRRGPVRGRPRRRFLFQNRWGNGTGGSVRKPMPPRALLVVAALRLAAAVYTAGAVSVSPPPRTDEWN